MGKCTSKECNRIVKVSSARIRKEDIRNYYTVTPEVIGKGVSSKVYKGFDRKGRSVAIKRIDKAKIQHSFFIRREIEISLSMDHENIVHYHEAFETEREFYIVMDYIEGGDLFKLIVDSPNQKLSEEESMGIFLQIMSVLNYLHNERRVIHRDIKPENFLIQHINGSPQIKLIDFGFAIRTKHNKRSLYSKNGPHVGTDIYLAPEVLSPSIKDSFPNEKVDVWGAGVVLFNMLSGSSPFSKENPSFSFDKQILLGVIDYSFISNKPIKQLMQLLFERDPEYRPSSSQVVNVLTGMGLEHQRAGSFKSKTISTENRTLKLDEFSIDF